jgi:hypothetical protein
MISNCFQAPRCPPEGWHLRISVRRDAATSLRVQQRQAPARSGAARRACTPDSALAHQLPRRPSTRWPQIAAWTPSPVRWLQLRRLGCTKAGDNPEAQVLGNLAPELLSRERAENLLSLLPDEIALRARALKPEYEAFVAEHRKARSPAADPRPLADATEGVDSGLVVTSRNSTGAARRLDLRRQPRRRRHGRDIPCVRVGCGYSGETAIGTSASSWLCSM